MTSVTPEPRPALAVVPTRRAGRLAAYGVGLVVFLLAAGWVGTHPAALPTSTATVTASTPVSTPVFVGVFAVPADSDRTLHVSGVRVHATSTTEATVTPRLCHGGSLNVTTTPETFCADLGPTEGASLGPGDSIVLEVVADDPGVVEVDRVRVAYRDGPQWDTQDAGAPSRVTVLAR